MVNHKDTKQLLSGPQQQSQKVKGGPSDLWCKVRMRHSQRKGKKKVAELLTVAVDLPLQLQN